MNSIDHAPAEQRQALSNELKHGAALAKRMGSRLEKSISRQCMGVLLEGVQSEVDQFNDFLSRVGCLAAGEMPLGQSNELESDCREFARGFADWQRVADYEQHLYRAKLVGAECLGRDPEDLRPVILLPIEESDLESTRAMGKRIEGKCLCLAAMIGGASNASQPKWEDATELARSDGTSGAAAVEYYVRLSQMAAIVGKGRRTLERLVTKGTLPAPCVEGGGGKHHEWRWSVVRPILSAHFSKDLPLVFPADPFR